MAGAPGPPRLLPQGGPGARVAGDQDGVQAGDVHAQLQGGGGGEPEQLAGVQGPLQGPALLGQVAAPVGGHPGRQRAVDGGEALLGDQGDQLGAAPGAHEGDRTDPLDDQVGQQVGGLRCGRTAHRGALLALQLGERRLPQGEDDLAARGGVVRDLRHREPGQPARGGRRVGGGGRGEQEDRVGAVAGAQPPQAAQHLGDVGAEDPAVGVALVDDHVAQGAQEGGPAGVGREYPPVQHVGIGQHVVGVLADPFAFLDGGVAVVDRGPDRVSEGPASSRTARRWSAARALVGARYRAVAPRPLGASAPSARALSTGAR